MHENFIMHGTLKYGERITKRSVDSSGYHCECNKGYSNHVEEGKLKCVDVDECTEEPLRHECSNIAQCVNMDGDYSCYYAQVRFEKLFGNC